MKRQERPYGAICGILLLLLFAVACATFIIPTIGGAATVGCIILPLLLSGVVVAPPSLRNGSVNQKCPSCEQWTLHADDSISGLGVCAGCGSRCVNFVGAKETTDWDYLLKADGSWQARTDSDAQREHREFSAAPQNDPTAQKWRESIQKLKSDADVAAKLRTDQINSKERREPDRFGHYHKD